MKAKTMKKLFLVAACVLLLTLTVVGITLTSSAAVTDDSGSCGTNVTYTFDAETGTLTISGTGEMQNYFWYSDVPWYYYSSYIKTATITDGVTSIGSCAFYDCSSLTSITIGDSVTSIGNYAFDRCSSLTSITIPDRVTSIGDSAFYECSSLTSITIGDGVTSIGEFAFQNCNSLTSITISDSVTSIGRFAFRDCDSLTSINIPDSVTSIGHSVFFCCSSLASITVDTANPNYTSIDGNLYDKNATTLIQYAVGKTDTSYTAPNSVTSISESAFYNCPFLTSVTLFDGVTSIGDNAFNSCSSLTSINIPEGITMISTLLFNNCSSLTNITIPDSVTSIGYGAFSSCSSLTKIIYCGTATDWDAISKGSNWDYNVGSDTANGTYTLQYHSYVNGTCEYCGAEDPNAVKILASGTCGDNVTWVLYETGELTISGTGAMTNYSYSSSLRAPWDSYRSSIKTVTIEDGVTSIGDYAFEDCNSLTSITIPDSVTSIGNDAFYYCSHLTNITIPDSVTSIGNRAFYDCSSLTSITIPNSVTSIGYSAFEDCSSLTNITIPDSVTSIGHSAFSGCTNLIQTETGVSYVDKWVIDCDTSVTSVTLRENTVGIEDSAFQDCYDLISIALPNNVTSIGGGAFAFCGLSQIRLPNSLKNLGSSVFYNTNFSMKIIYCGTDLEWNSVNKDSEWNLVWVDYENDVRQYLDRKIQYHSYVDGTCEFCGAANPVSINNVNIAIGQDITVNYYAMIPDSYTNLTMQFQMGEKTATVSGVATGVANQYVFSFEGVSPQCMGDAITAQLYSGTDLIAEKGAYTVKTYLEALINGDFDEKTKTVAKDTLIYGGAAQVYKNYNTDALVSEGITGSSYTLPSASGIEMSNGAGATFTNATIWFDNINKLRVKFTADSVENLIVKINGIESEYVLGDDGKYAVHTEALRATEFDKFFTFEIYINGSLVSSLKYSVNSYVYTMLSSTNEPMKNLAIALYNYGYSADIYNGTPQTPMISEEEAAKADPNKGFQGEEHLFTPFG